LKRSRGYINNVLGFPGLFRGALDAGVPRFSVAMLLAAAKTIAAHAAEPDLVPDPLDPGVHAAVREAALATAGEPVSVGDT
jgi:malate dehydrogenase (oxaloacetate-decarboxylating)